MKFSIDIRYNTRDTRGVVTIGYADSFSVLRANIGMLSNFVNEEVICIRGYEPSRMKEVMVYRRYPDGWQWVTPNSDESGGL